MSHTGETGTLISLNNDNINRLSNDYQTKLENIWEYDEPVEHVYRSSLRGNKRQPWRDDD